VVCREGWSAGETAIPILTLAEFAVGLAVTLAASDLFARGLTRLGTMLGLSEGLLGLLAALGADSPELSSAVIALLAGAGSVGVGVVVGSNLFNIAALLGLSAFVARGISIRRGPLILDAAIGLLVTAVAAAMVSGLLSPVASAVIIFPVAAAYVVVLAAPRPELRAVVPENLVEIPYELTHDRPRITHESWFPVLLIPVALVGVLGGSYVMVHEALTAQSWLHLSAAVLGTIVLAALTSLPNLLVALHFARRNRGTALFSSAMNSNTINLVGGLIVPALWIGTGSAQGSMPYFIWLIDLTLLAVLAPLPRSRLSRAAGAVIIAVYVIFVLLRVLGI
jgi:cation:H+ antiporter